MAQYIDKDALLAEIDRRIIELRVVVAELGNHESYECGAFHDIYLYEDMRSFIDTLEVKEVDLEKEFNKYFYNFTDPETGEKLKKEECWLDIKQARKFAKHFFGLGLKAQKGE